MKANFLSDIGKSQATSTNSYLENDAITDVRVDSRNLLARISGKLKENLRVNRLLFTT